MADTSSKMDSVRCLNPMIFHSRFSHISELIFKQLDIKSLKEFRLVAKSWKECIDKKNILWDRIVDKKFMSMNIFKTFIEVWKLNYGKQ